MKSIKAWFVAAVAAVAAATAGVSTYVKEHAKVTPAVDKTVTAPADTKPGDLMNR